MTPEDRPQPAPAAPADDRLVQLDARLAALAAAQGGWLPFDRFMHEALYAPGLGYYAHPGRLFGTMPASGSDFVTAPELSPLFGRVLARQVDELFAAGAPRTVIEFGAGSGALAAQLLGALGEDVRYRIIEVSAGLRARQRERLGDDPRVEWLDAWPQVIEGVVVGNEVLDAMPVKLLAKGEDGRWRERGVVRGEGGAGWRFVDRDSGLRPPLDAGYPPGSCTEIQPQAEAFIASLAERLACGAAIFIDYGFPQAEFHLPQRSQGTLMCHRAHRADPDPLQDVGAKDITAHVDFTGIALAGQDAGLQVAGYTSQANFLLNLGITGDMAAADLRERAAALKLVTEHEMGELFKVVAFERGLPRMAAWTGFVRGDRSHRL